MSDAGVSGGDGAGQAIRTAVVPAAGFGTRLRPLTNAVPKEMLPVGGKPALERIADELRAAGITEVVFVLSPSKLAGIQGYFGDGADGVTYRYALQPEMRGLGDAVLRAEPLLTGGGPFVVALGDAVFEEPAPGGLTGRLCAEFTRRDATVGLIVQKVARERISRYGVVRPAELAGDSANPGDGDSLLISDIVEKPAPEDAPSDLAAAARYVVRPEIFDTLRETPPGKGGEVQLTDALRAELGRGETGIAVPLRAGEVRHDIGSLETYYRAFAAFALADAENGPGLATYLRSRLSLFE
jgi:UTP--glucose-1-phosphate uridylyltransferase